MSESNHCPRCEALQAKIDGLEARIAAECKHSEESWVTWYSNMRELEARLRELESKHAVYGGGNE